MSTPIALPDGPERLATILSDERRRSIYLYVKRQPGPVTVNDVAEAFSIHRNAAKFHLDKLLDAGLLGAEFRRVNGRRGPGAGRPSKLYSATDAEVSFSVPERHYDLLAQLLLRALTSGEDLDAVGIRFGREFAQSTRAELGAGAEDGLEGVCQALERLGFQPHVDTDEDGTTWVTSENCPFGRVALEDRDGEVCRLDRAIVHGVLEAFSIEALEVREHASMRLGQGMCVREVVHAGPRVSEG